MFNVTVIRLNDLIKNFLFIILLLIIILLVKNNIKFQFAEIHVNSTDLLNFEMPILSQGHNNEIQLIDENTNEDVELGWYNKILNLEIGIFNVIENENEIQTAKIEGNQKDDLSKVEEQKDNEKNNSDEENNDDEKNDDGKNDNIELAKTELKTEVVTVNPLPDSYTQKYKGIKIKNETEFDLSDDILNTNSLEIDKSNIIIFHTHTCESYTSSEKYSYTPTGNFRTTDLNYSVARVGDELEKYLSKYDINVVHNKTYHDYPAYSGSYSRSLSTVSELLKSTKADIIIDLHRDAIGSNSSYAPTVKIGDEYCAQLMFVIGTNGGGLYHPNWQSNLQFAVKVQSIANETYSGLFKPIIVRNSRYNQHLGKAACIIEVGSTGNTLDQCLNSMKY